MDTANPSKKTPGKSLIALLVILTVAVIAAFLWWWDYRKYISTDDANLDSFRVNVAARVMAPMLTLHAWEGDTVKVGMLLAELDSSHVNTPLQEAAIYRIIAPVDGVIAKRWSLPGDMVQPGQTLFTINEAKDLWVAVYLEETKFSNIHPGQPATFTLDAYPEVIFTGKVFYIGSNTASEFSLIPPNNASGNYTKVAQRIPLKISIDQVEGKTDQKAKLKLVSGMSATVKIIKEK